jgi:restriction system protein
MPGLSQPTPANGTPACPKCGAAMEKRTGKSGPLAGREFWGCSSFPRCHGMLPAATG